MDTQTSSAHRELLKLLEAAVQSPAEGLPEDLLLAISGLTPLVNVDLLIEDGNGRKLLTWRDDEFYGPGWHLPGGIIRFKETAAERVRAVARDELGVEIAFESDPIAVVEFRHPTRRSRGHFISLLYRCRLSTDPAKSLRFNASEPRPGHWMWHEHCPENLLAEQSHYRRFFLPNDGRGNIEKHRLT